MDSNFFAIIFYLFFFLFGRKKSNKKLLIHFECGIILHRLISIGCLHFI